MKPFSIAIDGPAGAGKSTVAKVVAERLSAMYMDTGAMYRAMGLGAMRLGVNLTSHDAIRAALPQLNLELAYRDGQRVILNGEDVTGLIRTPEVSMAASKVATYGGVRAAMVALQQKLASETDMLLDGRDIGTRVLPDATVKIYLTASAEERARRRFLELQQKGAPDTYEQVLADLIRRDAQDMNREVDPLRQAEDAVCVDSTALSFDEVVDAILTIVEAKRK